MKTTFFYLLAAGLVLSLADNGRAQTSTPTPNTMYRIGESNAQQQTGAATSVVGYPLLGFKQYGLNVFINTQGASLSAAPVLGLPGTTTSYPTGSIALPSGANYAPNYPSGDGYDLYHLHLGFESTSALNAAVGSGTFTFTLGDATATPTLTLDTASPSFPVSPTITSTDTWCKNGFLVINSTKNTTLTFNTSAFTGYSTGLAGRIDYQLFDGGGNPLVGQTKSEYIPALGVTDPALSSCTIAAGTLAPGQIGVLEVDYEQIVSDNTTTFTGTGISGSPFGAAYNTSATFITLIGDPFSGTAAGNGLRGSGWFGYYTADNYPLIYHYGLGYLSVFPSGNGIYLYDYTSGHFFYTQSNYYPFLYDFTLNAFIYYYEGNAAGAKRHFYKFGANPGVITQ